MSLNELSSTDEQPSTSGNQLTAPVADSPDATTTATAFDWDVFADRGKALRYFRQTREAIDVMIVTNDDGEECVHLPIVSTLGPQFTKTLVTAMSDSNAETVQLDNGSEVKKIVVKDMDKQVLKSIIDMTYESTLCVSDDTVWPLIRAAIDYEMTDVLDASLLFLATRLDIDNCVQYFHLGIQHNHRLSNASFNFIKANFCDVIYKCMDFPELSADELTVLIASDDLNVKSEQTVYEAIIHWIQWSANERSGHLYPLLKNLRYARLDIEFIENTVAKNGLIVEDQDSQQLVNKFVDTFRTFTKKKDGYGLYVGLHPDPIRPRVPHEIAIVFGGWQEGVPSTMLEVYDIRTNRWFDTKISHNSPRAYHGMQIINGLVYVIGGTDGINILKSVQCFDTITKRWYDRQDMNEKRCYVSTVVVDGNIYAMGGHNGQHRIKSCEKYDPQTKVWTKIQDMNMSRSDGSATVYMGKIYIAGGLNDQMIESSVEFYDLTAKTWSLIMPMITPRTSLGFVALDDALYAIGGNNGFERLQSVEKYDIKLKSWQMVANMLSKRSTFATAVIENSIYVIGGYNGQTPICSVEKYDSLSQIWTPARSLNHDRSGLAVCVASGLSTAVDFTFIGRNELKLRKQLDSKDIDNGDADDKCANSDNIGTDGQTDEDNITFGSV
ncbi:kelch-like protein 10 [Oppia nitens]|uniref:kelch-like protein 10 n=1 Tax=Oppia nitens TaxID=1686743 RepID=UPI0023DA8E93|nr:kelch-like protein 10 [Oppia nitens]